MRRLPFRSGSVVTQAPSRQGAKPWVALASCALLFVLSACSGVSGGAGNGGGNTSATSTKQNPTQITLGSNIAAQLKAAQPQDATYNFEQSDGNASHGQKLGEGVATRTPDLFHQTWMISTSGQSTTIDQVYDYANGIIYQRFNGAGQWDRMSSKIAHYYDLQGAKLLGTETVNGSPTYHIRGTAVNDGQAFTMDVWARTDNLYPAQIWEMYAFNNQSSYYLFIATAYNTGATISIPSH
jgi:hypothetical protein